MYFKELEVQGFKSFLNRTKFRFQPGVTAIVGPNGCGKSNVVDAIKWVLGEQSSKSLRGSSMTEVIFNGTQQQDPVNVAEVHLTLSNEDRVLPVDYDEVTIGRRLYRSGESEYLLNNLPVRLSDIRQLLMGTGMGTSSYSIVEQGKMDQLISSRPEERRYVFEEASGITRYKAKKHQAELKLERTRDNLTRLNDIISEVERQIGAIERKAKKAERYNKYFNELKDLEIGQACRKYAHIERDERELGDKGTGLAEESDQIRTRLEDVRRELDDLKKRAREAEVSVSDLRQTSTRTESELMRNRELIHIHTERISELEREVERLDSEIDSDLEEKEQLTSRREILKNRLEEVSSKRGRQQEILEQMEHKVKCAAEEMNRAKHELNMGRERLVEIATRRSQLENLMVKVDTDMRNCTTHKRRLMADRKDVTEELIRLEREYEGISAEAGQLEEQLRSLTEHHESLRTGCAETARALDELKAEKADKEKELNAIRPRREFLEKLITEREGISEPVKRVLKKAEESDAAFEGVLGVLSELISVEPGYDQTLEAVLGDVAQAIVVRDRRTADNIADFLKAEGLGSVSLLIVEELKGIDEGILGELDKGTIDDITQVFTAREPVSSALRAYLRDTFITVSPEAARYFVLNETHFRGRIICEHGEVYAKGAHRSRSYSQEQNIPLLGRQEKVNSLLASEEELNASINALGSLIEEKKSWLDDALRRKETAEVELREIERRHADTRSRKEHFEANMRSLKEELTVIESEVSDMDEQLALLNDKKEQTAATIKEIDAENSSIVECSDKCQDKIKRFAEQREGYVFELAEIRAAFNSLSREEETLSSGLERDDTTLGRLEQKISTKRERITDSSGKIEHLGIKIESLQKECEQQQRDLAEKTEKLETETALRDELGNDLARLEEEVQVKEQRYRSSQDSTHELDMSRKELEYQKRSIVDHVRTAYGEDITTLSASFEEVEDVASPEAGERIVWLKERIERMGPVSLDAVDEQEELKTRYEFLTSQRDDLLHSKASVQKAIREINSTTKKQFMESFTLIREQFNLYFKMLFNGGKAELVLQDEDDVLETGIDIIVRPPGKKLHNVLQLSGGEKALTAIALIFSIFKVNPSPFCVLDEIDAPLDESNIMRFTRVLQEFLKLSQFVVVTHNRLTIQLAEALYGVTMQEKGVSKVVSVKFRESDESFSEETAPAAV